MRHVVQACGRQIPGEERGDKRGKLTPETVLASLEVGWVTPWCAAVGAAVAVGRRIQHTERREEGRAKAEAGDGTSVHAKKRRTEKEKTEGGASKRGTEREELPGMSRAEAECARARERQWQRQ